MLLLSICFHVCMEEEVKKIVEKNSEKYSGPGEIGRVIIGEGSVGQGEREWIFFSFFYDSARFFFLRDASTTETAEEGRETCRLGALHYLHCYFFIFLVCLPADR